MLGWLIGLLQGGADRRMREVMRFAAIAVVSTLAACVGLGFGTFAGYIYLRASQGPAIAALIVGAIYMVLAIAIYALGSTRRRVGGERAASSPASPVDFESIAGSFAAAGSSREQLAWVAAMELGRALTPLQLVAVALIGGFVAGRRIRK